MRNKKALIIARTGILSALSLVFIYVGGFLPTMRLSLAAAAGVAAAFVTAHSGPAYGAACYIVTALLSLLLAPASPWLYIAFFGWYPVIKSIAERTGRLVFEWLIKFTAFNAAFFLMWFLIPAALSFDIPGLNGVLWLLVLAGNVVFAIFDFGLSKIIYFYFTKILKKLT